MSISINKNLPSEIEYDYDHRTGEYISRKIVNDGIKYRVIKGPDGQPLIESVSNTTSTSVSHKFDLKQFMALDSPRAFTLEDIKSLQRVLRTLTSDAEVLERQLKEMEESLSMAKILEGDYKKFAEQAEEENRNLKIQLEEAQKSVDTLMVQITEMQENYENGEGL